MPYSVIRSHEICAGHRVVGHESKCRHLHGHNYVFHFKVQPVEGGLTTAKENELRSKFTAAGMPAEKIEKIISDRKASIGSELDAQGRVIDFSVVKSTLCQWLEDNWDHKFLHWEKDAVLVGLSGLAQKEDPQWGQTSYDNFLNSLVSLPFNPTAENLAAHMVNVVGPMLLAEYGVELVSCTIEETSKCHVEYTK